MHARTIGTQELVLNLNTKRANPILKVTTGILFVFIPMDCMWWSLYRNLDKHLSPSTSYGQKYHSMAKISQSTQSKQLSLD